jgi:transcriptional regulator with XRE-family HTH domain
MRERAQLSQAVFARHLNLTVGYVAQLERRAKQPTGATFFETRNSTFRCIYAMMQVIARFAERNCLLKTLYRTDHSMKGRQAQHARMSFLKEFIFSGFE